MTGGAAAPQPSSPAALQPRSPAAVRRQAPDRTIGLIAPIQRNVCCFCFLLLLKMKFNARFRQAPAASHGVPLVVSPVDQRRAPLPHVAVRGRRTFTGTHRSFIRC